MANTFRKLGLIDHSLSLSLAAAQVVGAILLWQLRRPAFYLFLAALVLCILNFWWQVLIRDWVGAMHRIEPSVSAPALVVLIISQALLVGVCVYTWRLAKRRFGGLGHGRTIPRTGPPNYGVHLQLTPSVWAHRSHRRS